MTNNEVINGLECWIKNFDGKAVELTILCGALLLINRLKAENKNCGKTIQNQREQLKACNEKIREQQTEIERLRYNLEAVLDERADHSEAVKEFWNELKRRNTLNPLIVSTITGDNLLKERECE